MLETITKTGGLVDTSDGAYRFQGLTVRGETIQNFWRNTAGTSNGVTVTESDSGTLSASGTAGSSAALIQTRIFCLEPSTKYTLSVNKTIIEANVACVYVRAYGGSDNVLQEVYVGAEKGSNPLSSTFTTPSNITYAYVGVLVQAGNSISFSGLRVMLNKGSVAEPWYPPGINCIDTLSLMISGKNMFNETSIPTGVVQGVEFEKLSDGGLRVTGTASSRVQYYGVNHRILPAGTYTVSTNNPGSITGVGIFAVMHHRSGDNVYIDAWNAGSVTFTLEELTEVSVVLDIRVPWEGGKNGIDCVVYPQFEAGSRTAYEKPSVTYHTIDLDGNGLYELPNGVYDELTVDANGKVSLLKRTHTVHYGNTDTFTGNFGINEYVEHGISVRTAQGTSANASTDLCDLLRIRNPDGSNLCFSGWVYTTSNTAFRIGGFKDIGETYWFTSNTVLQSILGEKGVTYVYERETPDTIDLGKIDVASVSQIICAFGSIPAEVEAKYYKRAVNGDGVEVAGKHSYYSDLLQCVSTRDTGAPEKKLSTKTVPYMSGFYDFSKVYGAIAYESRELSYSFDVIGSRAEVQAQKSALMNWLADAHDCDIYDDDIADWHFHGSLSSMDWSEDDSGESGTLEVTFLCHPFLIADGETTQSLAAGSRTVTIEGQPVNPTAKTSSGAATITIGGIQQSVSTTPTRLTAQLMPGSNSLTISGGTVQLTYREQKL